MRNRRLPQPGQPGARAQLEGLNVDDYWTAEHEKELAFANKKADARRLQAQREGALLPEEQTADTAAEAGKQVDKMLQGVEGRRRLARRRAVMASGAGSLDALQGLRAFASAGVDKNLSALRKLRLEWVGNVMLADVLVVTKQQTFRDPHAWLVRLKGLFTLTLATSSSSSSAPSFSLLKFNAAIRQPASIYTTDNFRTQHPDHASILDRCTKADGSKWRKMKHRKAYAGGDTRKSARVYAIVSGADRRKRKEQNNYY